MSFARLAPQPKVALVGDCPSVLDIDKGFLWSSNEGKLLDESLCKPRTDFLVTSVFRTRALGNNPANFFDKKSVRSVELKAQGHKHKDIQLAYKGQPSSCVASPFPLNGSQGFVKRDFEPDLAGLRDELSLCKFAIALGPLALWALCGVTGLANYRGAWIASTLCPGLWVLPTYAPDAVFRLYDLRPTFCADLVKALEQNPSAILKRRVFVAETLDDLLVFEKAHIAGSACLALDVETEQGQITELSVAPSAELTLMIPIWSPDRPGLHSWSESDEIGIWKWLWRICQTHPLVMHNCLYDLTYLWHHGIRVPLDQVTDTMFLAHSAQPEMQKSLGYLASLYCNVPSWKHLRTKAQYLDNKDEA